MSETYQNEIRKIRDLWKNQKEAPTASGVWNSDRAWNCELDSRREIAVRVENVGFRAETLLL